jgi:AhpD family alkylhydroperoxidase
MKSRLSYKSVDPAAYKALLNMEDYIENCDLEVSLLDLVRLRASQINGCAYCLDMHAKDARASGETEQRLYALSAWEDTPFFTDRERAALAWTEAVTLLTEGHVSDETFAQVRPHFTDQELVSLTMAVIGINSWNRVNVAFRMVPGAYKSDRQPKPEFAKSADK